MPLDGHGIGGWRNDQRGLLAATSATAASTPSTVVLRTVRGRRGRRGHTGRRRRSPWSWRLTRDRQARRQRQEDRGTRERSTSRPFTCKHSAHPTQLLMMTNLMAAV
jgi:hypothetical protein